MGMESFDLMATFAGACAPFARVMDEVGARARASTPPDRAHYWEIVTAEYIVEIQFTKIDGATGRASVRMAVCCDPAGLSPMLDVARRISARFGASRWRGLDCSEYVDVASPNVLVVLAEQFDLKRKRLLGSFGLVAAPMAAKRCNAECLEYLEEIVARSAG